MLPTKATLVNIPDGGCTVAVSEGFDGFSLGIVETKWRVHESMAKGKWDLPEVVRPTTAPTSDLR